MTGGADTTIKSMRTKIAESALALGEALSGCVVRRLSIHDATGQTVWISGTALDTDEQEFVLDALDRDNESEALLLGVHYDRPKFFVNLTG